MKMPCLIKSRMSMWVLNASHTFSTHPQQAHALVQCRNPAVQGVHVNAANQRVQHSKPKTASPEDPQCCPLHTLSSDRTRSRSGSSSGLPRLALMKVPRRHTASSVSATASRSGAAPNRARCAAAPACL